MSKLEINAIFYSKQNLNMAYDLKRACRDVGISVIYAFEVVELVKYLTELKVNIVFIDCSTLMLSENIFSFIKSYNKNNHSLIICITDNVNCKELSSFKDVDFIFKNESLLEQLKEIENSISVTAVKNYESSLNLCEINSYLTDYLISIGVSPKHIGFTFIKQAIELALKNNGVIGSLSREVYPTIASKNKTLSQNVERNIRNAIECACKSTAIYSDNVVNLMQDEKISNREFLCYLLDRVLNTYSNK